MFVRACVRSIPVKYQATKHCSIKGMHVDKAVDTKKKLVQNNLWL